MLVFDTSAFINGQRDHLPLETFPSVWDLVAECMEDGRIIAPREVYRELTAKDDDVKNWATGIKFTEPGREVQQAVGPIYAEFNRPGRRDSADPFVIAEARVRGFTVVTYEGRTFSGVPTTRWERSMPGICRHMSVNCATLPEAFALLGASF